MPGFEPQTDVQIDVIGVADADVATNQTIPVASCPVDVNCLVEVISVSVVAGVLPTAANAAVSVHDASADTDTELKAATDIVTGASALELATLFRGSRDLDPGDTISVTLTGVTAGSVESLSFVVEKRVKRHS